MIKLFTQPMISFIQKHHLKLFVGCWLLLQFIQAYSTDLLDDEAYYWVYSNFPAWGYFDHPPLVAILIKWGYAIFPNELGVRFFCILLNTFTLLIIRKLLPQKNDGLFYLIVCSMAVLQLGGIMSVPDIPLSFFTAVFLLSYKMFLEQQSALNIFFIGIIMALLLYSKYHGLLIILFTLFSNPKLAFKYQAWIAVSIAIFLFMPHLIWQYNRDFPSLRYHLFERVADNYSFSFTSEFIIGQILIAGPLTGWLLLWSSFRYKTKDIFERSLKFILVGLYVFFLLSTFRGRVEANWTISAFIPLIILSHQYLLQEKKLIKILLITVPVTLSLVMVARIFMMLNIPSNPYIPKDEFHQNKEWAMDIHEKANGLPVVFINSYQKASKYWFYSGEPAFSLNTVRYRRNNYNFWPLENSFSGKKVMVVSPYNYYYYRDIFFTTYGKTGCTITDSFYSFSGINISAEKSFLVKNGKLYSNNLISNAGYDDIMRLKKSGLGEQPIRLYVSKNDKKVAVYFTNIQLKNLQPGRQSYTLDGINVLLPKGHYEAVLSLPSSMSFDPSLNSTVTKFIVE